MHRKKGLFTYFDFKIVEKISTFLFKKVIRKFIFTIWPNFYLSGRFFYPVVADLSSEELATLAKI
jgi:hypothetical protein